jgi:hypothetical protein
MASRTARTAISPLIGCATERAFVEIAVTVVTRA